ncbi:heparan-alpha-glucosaminide N-acetyltransferase domain-containing protein [Demequina oxidasica]|uniref:heparan-alpha-glucosaminide N-acetyltransferase domain-containing protein n=1 Tax=Demequina oxidasica TaxID=676199 RepID=UPI000780D7CD|nr:heparan-alpha-glucosaminide N-acetyltransferase domain-containing protein [Demequina oxidasica]
MPRPARIEGLDVARALAILGMFGAHVGDHQSENGWAWLTVTHGRPSALFAILAGVSISLMLTRKAGVTGDLAPASAVTHTRWRVAVRGIILMVLGLVLSELGTPVIVILTNLGVMFLLSVIAFRWQVWWLWVGAAVCFVLGQLAVRTVATGAGNVGLYDLPVVGKLWFETYPAISWMGYILAGMAIGRLTLTARRTQVLLGVVGVAGLLIVKMVEVVAGGAVRTDDSLWLSTEAHSYSPLEMAGNLASACLVIAVCLWAAQAARPAVWPLIAAGSMALTLYVAHLIVIAAVGDEVVYEATNVAYAVLCLSAILFASLWRWLVGQGPLEKLLSVASMAAANAVVGNNSEGPDRQRATRQ